MNKFLKAARNSIGVFARDEEGAQVVEYALIIAAVSIALIVLLRGLTETGGAFELFITRVSDCLTGPATCV